MVIVVFEPYNSGGVSLVEEEIPEQASGQTSEMKLMGGPGGPLFRLQTF